MKPRLLIVYSTQTGRTRQLVDAAIEGASELADEVEIELRLALETGVDDLMACTGLLIGTPENFGYMSGAVKDFLDRTYYPCEGKRIGLPYALLVSAGNDGSGAVRAIERIATGYGWNAVAAPLVAIGEQTEAQLAQAREIGQLMAAGLSCGIF
ncbi:MULTISPECIES: flavodoxin family protein [Hydrocarboniphaga]|jgi:multimeric flavodoxin WrbA|uniref:Flavodoxin n=1 Tax=Hydrocarboniphaga effusa AP103 TaxID=1172194 RepID=I8T673_9GAMM|nr:MULTISPECIES: NAD(P)H-dependent oxidoreductase [Hydrocarboniphaga]EIT69243.1 flavodoxin [Hydrocarboniphaga effusa AP103]MDZ4078085.1 NAD(P)H-dependent oxidoreductase [Hydrocarboniphaga sp.]